MKLYVSQYSPDGKPHMGHCMLSDTDNNLSFTSCDEYGNADWLPDSRIYAEFVDESTSWAFLGETVIHYGKELAVLKYQNKHEK